MPISLFLFSFGVVVLIIQRFVILCMCMCIVHRQVQTKSPNDKFNGVETGGLRRILSYLFTVYTQVN